MDNSNVWFVYVDGATDSLMKAITCVVNSTIFSVLSKSGANPQAGGYYKFNKQFLAPIPFPSSKLKNNSPVVTKLSSLYDDIVELQQQYTRSSRAVREMLSHTLKANEVSETEREQIADIGRTTDRIELLDGVN